MSDPSEHSLQNPEGEHFVVRTGVERELTEAEKLGLVDGEFTVQRSDGSLQTGWKIGKRYIDSKGVDGVQLVSEKFGTKGVPISELLSWQAEIDDDVNDTIPNSRRQELLAELDAQREREAVAPVAEEVGDKALDDVVEVDETVGEYTEMTDEDSEQLDEEEQNTLGESKEFVEQLARIEHMMREADREVEGLAHEVDQMKRVVQGINKELRQDVARKYNAAGQHLHAIQERMVNLDIIAQRGDYSNESFARLVGNTREQINVMRRAFHAAITSADDVVNGARGRIRTEAENVNAQRGRATVSSSDAYAVAMNLYEQSGGLQETAPESYAAAEKAARHARERMQVWEEVTTQATTEINRAQDEVANQTKFAREFGLEEAFLNEAMSTLGAIDGVLERMQRELYQVRSQQDVLRLVADAKNAVRTRLDSVQKEVDRRHTTLRS